MVNGIRFGFDHKVIALNNQQNQPLKSLSMLQADTFQLQDSKKVLFAGKQKPVDPAEAKRIALIKSKCEDIKKFEDGYYFAERRAIKARNQLIKLCKPEDLKYVTPLLSDKKFYVQMDAMLIVGAVGSPDQVRRIIGPRLGHPFLPIRQAAINILGKQNDLETMKLLTKAIKDKDLFARGQAVHLLKRYVRKEGSSVTTEGKTIRQEIIDQIKPILDDNRLWIKAAAISAIGYTGKSEHVNIVAPFLKDNEEMIRSHAVWAIGNMGTKKHVRELVAPCLWDRSPRVMSSAEDAVRKKGFDLSKLRAETLFSKPEKGG